MYLRNIWKFHPHIFLWERADGANTSQPLKAVGILQLHRCMFWWDENKGLAREEWKLFMGVGEPGSCWQILICKCKHNIVLLRQDSSLLKRRKTELPCILMCNKHSTCNSVFVLMFGFQTHILFNEVGKQLRREKSLFQQLKLSKSILKNTKTWSARIRGPTCNSLQPLDITSLSL